MIDIHLRRRLKSRPTVPHSTALVYKCLRPLGHSAMGRTNRRCSRPFLFSEWSQVSVLGNTKIVRATPIKYSKAGLTVLTSFVVWSKRVGARNELQLIGSLLICIRAAVDCVAWTWRPHYVLGSVMWPNFLRNKLDQAEHSILRPGNNLM